MGLEFILYSICVFLITILLLVVTLLLTKKFLSPSGKVNITINEHAMDCIVDVRPYTGITLEPDFGL